MDNSRLFSLVTVALATTGCAGLAINDIELSPQGIAYELAKSAAQAVVREARNTAATGPTQRFVTALAGEQFSLEGGISPQAASVAQAEYQATVDRLITQVRKIQDKEPESSFLRKKGRLRDVKLVVLNDNSLVNAWSQDDIIEPKIFLPTGLIVRTLLALQYEQSERRKDAKDLLSRRFVGFTSYVPFLEFEELLRLVLAHELAHIWLHEPGLDIRAREIEADAWGVALSATISTVVEFRTKQTAQMLDGGFSTRDPLDFALMQSRYGFQVYDLLYSNQHANDQQAERQSATERRKSVMQAYSTAFDKHLASVTTSELIAFKLMREAMK